MKTFKAHEFKLGLPLGGDITPTGRVETYQAADMKDAVDKLLYTRKLNGGKAFVGPTGRSVYSGNATAWTMVAA